MTDVTRNDTEASDIARLSGQLATARRGASAQTGAILQCIVAAATPLLTNLFDEETPHQDRLLFALALTGACSTISKPNEDRFGLEVSVTPITLTEAIRVYMLLTGKDIRPYLPKSLVNFANTAKYTLN